jgi:transposase
VSPLQRKSGDRMSKKRRIFDKEFKSEAVKLATKGDRTIREVAETLKINYSLLGKWIKSSREEGPEAFRGQGNRTAVEEEIWQLKLENTLPRTPSKVSAYKSFPQSVSVSVDVPSTQSISPGILSVA